MFSVHHVLKAPRARVLVMPKKRFNHHIKFTSAFLTPTPVGGGSSFPSGVFLLAAACTVGAVLASPSLDFATRTSISDAGVTRCDASAVATTSTSQQFQVQAALEMKSEMQKVRLAQIIHDLHALAREEEAKKKPTLLRRYVTMFRSKSPTSNAKTRSGAPHNSTTTSNGEINLAGVNLSKLTPEMANKLIQDIQDGARLNPQSFLALVNSVSQLLLEEPTVLDLRNKAETVNVVGDLHGSLSCLASVLRLSSFGDSNVIIFDGDFVDRGEDSVEVLCTLLLLKLAHPHHVFLLRGNHEDSLVASVYGFQDEVRQKYGGKLEEKLWDNLSTLFATLPIAAQTETALILHGGIPSVDFDLNNLAKISPKERSKILTTIEPKSPAEQIISEVLWSDPNSRVFGIHDNPRGMGKAFGTDVAKHVLKRHNLKYLVRGHEVAEKGVTSLNCGQGREVLTVFSSANYPNGEGSNLGAVLTLDSKGSYQSVVFSYQAKASMGKKVDTIEMIRSLIKPNRRKLEQAFQSVSTNGQITVAQWSKIMAESLDLPDLEWNSLQPSLAPDMNGDRIDWKAFLIRHALKVGGADANHAVESDQAEILHETHEMLMTVFKYLDVDRSGEIDMDEFRTGVAVLNKRLPKDRQLQDPESLFRALDTDGNGAIDMKEFEQLFSVL